MFTYVRLTPILQSSIDLCKTITPHKFHIYHNEHIPMADCPLQSSIDALNTATPNLAHLMADLYIYRTMHIYIWQIDPTSSSN